MTDGPPRRDALEVFIHFVVSAIVGAICGALAWNVWLPDLGLWLIVGGALFFGVVGAWLGDAFWHAEWNPLRWLRWWS